jgi:hypothetical protein
MQTTLLGHFLRWILGYLLRHIGLFRRRCLCCLLIALTATGGALAHPGAAQPAASSYRMIHLVSVPYGRACMNDRGQVAFEAGPTGKSRVRFFDGRSLRDFGALGGCSATVADVNELGQIAFNLQRKGGARAMF